jgi:hypothetical protein
MKHMFYAEDNASNYIVIRDMSADDNDTAIVNFDLSDDEIREIARKFAENENDTSFYADEPVWEPFGDIMSSMTMYKSIDSYLEEA